VGALALFLFARPYLGSAAAGDAQVLRISMGGWEPATLTARPGETVTVAMVNLDNQFHVDGGGWHNFVVPELGLEVEVPPRATETFTFTVGEAGEYLFYCDICCGGKENPFMQGTLSVS
jgi:heme/copper-type cytochrome/quinol oxidase subunit 2